MASTGRETFGKNQQPDKIKKQPDILNSEIIKERELFIISIQPREFRMNMKVKLKNTEMWVCDYSYSLEKSQQRA